MQRRLEAELIARDWNLTRSSAASTTARPPTRSPSATACSAFACSRPWTGIRFFERSSLVEKILRDDPAGAYPQQDFATSDRYRKAVEKIARGSNADELDRGAAGHRAGPDRPRAREPRKVMSATTLSIAEKPRSESRSDTGRICASGFSTGSSHIPELSISGSIVLLLGGLLLIAAARG